MNREGDARYMRRAVELAGRGLGLTSPNPVVGAVAVRGGEIVGEGFHQRAGEAHAEVSALAAAGPRAEGATLYVTLEPCVHHGKTPPCVDGILQAGVGRVVVAVQDPNPLVNGRGLERLRDAGVDVTVGVEQEAATRLNRPFFKYITTGRPFVTLKVAMTLDGKIADREGSSRWITGEAARGLVHRMRSQADAILVGIGTVLKDDPGLTVRLERPWPREPFRVVVDSRLRTPPDARLIRAGRPDRVIVACVDLAPPERAKRLDAQGIQLLSLPGSDGRVDLAGLMAALGARQIVSVLAEGGSEIGAALLEQGLVDRVAWFVAPCLLGGQAAPGPVGGAGRRLKEALHLRNVTWTPVGDDLLVEGDVDV